MSDLDHLEVLVIRVGVVRGSRPDRRRVGALRIYADGTVNAFEPARSDRGEFDVAVFEGRVEPSPENFWNLVGMASSAVARAIGEVKSEGEK